MMIRITSIHLLRSTTMTMTGEGLHQAIQTTIGEVLLPMTMIGEVLRLTITIEEGPHHTTMIVGVLAMTTTEEARHPTTTIGEVHPHTTGMIRTTETPTDTICPDLPTGT
jgi:hypothetical protein